MKNSQTNILIVDDEPRNLRILEGILAPLEYNLEKAENGIDALSQVEKELPDIILLDVMMPGMSGFEVCRTLKSQPYTQLIPIVLVTSLSDKDSKITGIDCGADDFITKPVNSIELRARVKSLLRIKSLYDELMEKNVELQNTMHQLEVAQKKLILHEKMASLGNLVAGVAHEINTPLGAMISNNDTFIRSVNKIKDVLSDSPSLVDALKDPTLAKLFTGIENLSTVSKTASDRIVKIVNSLRSFARLDQAEKDTVDIHEGIESTLTLVHHELKGRIEVHKDFGDLPLISCYPNRINQVFMNILVNAGHSIPEKGDIYIKTFTKDDKAVIEISDTGNGISKENLNRIFDPGFTTKSKGIGTGLGLSIVYQIIEDHNGSIEVESEIGKGSMFRIILPI
ncbi:response regulator [Candidatus Latescibacterota bacterium]